MERNRGPRSPGPALVLATLLLAGVTPAANAAVTAFAAASLRDAFSAVSQAFERDTGIRVRTSYAASGTLARQIERGAPAEVFISANSHWMDYLDEHDAIAAGSRYDLLRNRLVLIAPADSDVRLPIARDFPLADALGKRRLAMGHPAHVPAGEYGKQALQALGVWRSVKAKVARAANVRAALALVVRGGAPLGIVYRTDAMAADGVRIVDTFPADSHRPIVYPAARVPRDDADADRLLAYLRSKRALQLFGEYGFAAAQ